MNQILALDPLGANWTHDALPRVLPVKWRLVVVSEDGAKYLTGAGSTLLSVIASSAVELDERRWLHVSLARPARLPSYDDLVEVKETFIGRDRKAVMVLPPRAEHVNIHPNCLHLWHCLDGDPLPDFTRGGSTL